MPELPDIAAYICALEDRILGRPLVRLSIARPFVLRTAQPPVSEIEGRAVREIRRIGKRIAMRLDGDDWLVLHLMIAGRLRWSAERPSAASRAVLATFEFPNGWLRLTEAGSKRRASIHIVRGSAALSALDPGGVDVFEAGAQAFRAALSAENRTLKRALTDPRALSGIGNAYSDEILHAARLSPIMLTRSLNDEDWERLYDATRSTLRVWIDRLQDEARVEFPTRVTAFRSDMAVHGRYGQACPRCGAKIQRIRYADNETNYCPRCQTGGRILADRALSRLLKADWPRTLEELES
ncbi:MAG: formamidopyrimidine-DNA glycosylase [Candidatus Eremiobacteraeota bacterium]|nr:formamidopyrimidine-DNA glycosylase [Candidatus Eremiobacteraeota bacterium]